LQVSEHGDRIDHWGETLQRRGAKTVAEPMEALGAWLWKAFPVVYQAWIPLTRVG
jgi:hypothetical protein